MSGPPGFLSDFMVEPLLQEKLGTFFENCNMFDNLFCFIISYNKQQITSLKKKKMNESSIFSKHLAVSAGEIFMV